MTASRISGSGSRVDLQEAGAAAEAAEAEAGSAQAGPAEVGSAPGAPGAGGPSAPVRRLRLVAVCVALTAVAFQQRPGYLAPDTKLDLVVNPGGFLHRALNLWEPLGAFGQVQNQAYGYLFPMGPFFWLGRTIGLPAWAVQRFWIALVLCLAFTGAVKLAEVLDIGSATTRLVAGVAFALSPRLVTVVGAVSIEALPTALAPWVLVPLVLGARRGSPRRWAALSGLAVFCVGGVNAAATLAVLPLAALWLLCLPRGPRRRRLAGWWVVSVGLATLWWLVPLLLLGQYSPPFLDFIESAAVTTGRTSLVEVLRGTSHWIPYLTDPRGPVWPAGAALLSQPALIVDTVLVAGLGLAALLRRDMPHRRWALLGALLGVAAVSFGHVGPVDGLLADQQRSLLDGVLAPLRNVHKYDVLLRLPLVLGLCHLLSRATSARAAGAHLDARRRGLRWQGPAALLLVITAMAGVAAPAVVGRLVPRGSFTDIPGYWKDAARWLGDHSGAGRTLLLPGSSFADYYWGRPGDEPMQPLARSAWAVRNAIPLTPPETIRMMDAVERRLATGQGSPGLATYLARAGVRYVLVRNDLDYAAAGSARPLLVHQALVDSPGLSLATTFGPVIGGGNRPGLLVDQDLDVPLRAVEVFAVEVAGGAWADPRVSVTPLAATVRVAGGPEALLELADRGLLDGQATVLAGDGDGAVPASAPVVVTDSPRRREVQFGRLVDNSSATLGPNDRPRPSGPALDYLWPAAAGREVVARLLGARAVRASSSASDPNVVGPTAPEHEPYAALDRSVATSWRSNPLDGPVGAWWQVDLDQPVTGGVLRFSLDPGAPGAPATEVRVSTDSGSVRHAVLDPGAEQAVELPAGSTSRVRITVTGVAGNRRIGAVGLREVVVPGLVVSRTLVLPIPPTGSGAPVLAFASAEGRRDGCFRFVGRSLCAAGLVRAPEERVGVDRTVTLGDSASYHVSVVVRPRGRPELSRLLAASRPGLQASTSSAAVGDPAGSAQAAVDADRGTGWVAAPGDKNPWLRLRWPAPVTVSGLGLAWDRALAASQPRELIVSSPAGDRRGRLDEHGVLRFAALRTDELTIRFADLAVGISVNPYDLRRSLLPVGVSEVVPLGPGADLRQPEDRGATVRIRCGQAVALRIGGEVVPFGGVAARGALLDLRPVTLHACGEQATAGRPAATGPAASRPTVTLPAGISRIRVLGTALFDVQAVTMVPTSAPDIAQRAAGPELWPTRWQPIRRTLWVAARTEPTLVVVHENANPGWQARLDGRPLAEVRVDGWQQGWVVPAGAAGKVELRYRPNTPYQAALLAGLGAVLALVLLAVLRPGRAAPPPAERPGAPGWGTGLVGFGVLLAVGGPVGLGIAALLLAVVLLALRGRWRERALVAVALVGFGLAGMTVAVHPWPHPGYGGESTLAQVAALVALAALAVAWVVDRPLAGSHALGRRPRAQIGTRFFRLRTGRSTR